MLLINLLINNKLLIINRNIKIDITIFHQNDNKSQSDQ